MCGITGLILERGPSGRPLDVTVGAMSDRLAHRGPDDAGVWVDEAAGVALGHRRLSILDLSAAGHQPMASACGRYVIAFNGEIYNHGELRQVLDRCGPAGGTLAQGGGWRGHSDTETLLAAIAAWGLAATLTRCVGMFAIALWDRQARTLSLARDRFGEKPLYYGWVGQGAGRAFAFASELKALRAYPGFDNPVCRDALAQYLRFMVVPAPLSIYAGLYKLEPGCVLTLAAAPGGFGQPDIRRYWSLSEAVAAGRQDPVTDEAGALCELEARLSEAVRLQSLADVPLGAFLSGGVDSSTIVALMQHNARREGRGPVQTFTVGFDASGYDESASARAVARHLGTDHTELRVGPAQALAVIPRLPTLYDEPFADASQIPTHLVSRAARERVTVALSGDGADELFGGYNRYVWAPRVWSRVAWLPFGVRQKLAWMVRAVPLAGWDALSGLAGVSRLGDKAWKLAARLDAVRTVDDLYWRLVSEWADPGTLVQGFTRPAPGAQEIPPPAGLDPAERMMFRDATGYLRDDILCKLDRAAMAVGLETRVPFLDHRVAEWAWHLPQSMKIRGRTGKWALRQLLYKHVPRELIERPKAGFGIPVGQWLRGPLRGWAEALLDGSRLSSEGYLNPAPIREAWRQHQGGRFDWTARLWAVLMFQSWLEENG
jgi:asparagine synthase (glutamine-hydrolysing)